MLWKIYDDRQLNEEMNNKITFAVRQEVIIKTIINETMKFYGVTYEEITVKCRKRHLVKPRRVAISLMTLITNISYEKITYWHSVCVHDFWGYFKDFCRFL